MFNDIIGRIRIKICPGSLGYFKIIFYKFLQIEIGTFLDSVIVHDIHWFPLRYAVNKSFTVGKYFLHLDLHKKVTINFIRSGGLKKLGFQIKTQQQKRHYKEDLHWEA